MGAGPIRASTGGRRTKPTSTGCRRLRQPEPGRRSTYQAGEPVQTNRASSEQLEALMKSLGQFPLILALGQFLERPCPATGIGHELTLRVVDRHAHSASHASLLTEADP